MTEKTKLPGGLEKTVTWIWLEKGHLKIEYYDFSEDAKRMFGNDIAYTITVRDMPKLLSTVGRDENSLIPWMLEYFKSYFGIKQWLEENKIEFDIEIESQA